jgi:hypothetical protein
MISLPTTLLNLKPPLPQQQCVMRPMPSQAPCKEQRISRYRARRQRVVPQAEEDDKERLDSVEVCVCHTQLQLLCSQAKS